MGISRHLRSVKNLLWPINQGEYGKLVPMFLLFFLVSFVYHLLRNMKISLIITLKGSGANTIPFLKIGCVLPSAILITYIFTKLASRFNREQVFYYIVFGFIAYFFLFTFILFPNQDLLELNQLHGFLKQHVFTASGLDGMLAIIRYWNIALFYVVSELWSTAVLSMLVWGFANEITKLNEAKRFYAVFGLGVNSAGIAMGFFASWITNLALPHIAIYHDRYQWVFYQLIVVLIFSIAIVCLFYYLNHYQLSKEASSHISIKEKAKISLRESLLFLRESKYLLYLVSIVLAYNIVFNLTDVVWTHRAKILYVNSKDFYAYMNKVTIITGIIATLFGGFISGAIIRQYGWTKSALVTPLIWLVTGLLFYSSILVENSIILDLLAAFFGNPANLILLLGTIQITFGRGAKYTIFDATKEMTFIPLTKAEQRKAKAVVDGIASRLGKSFGSIFYICLLLMFGNIASTIPFVSVFIILLIIGWTYAIIKIGKLNSKLDETYTLDKSSAAKERQ